MKTSYFAKPGMKANPAAVSIALYTPRWWGKGRRAPELAPTKAMLNAGYSYGEYIALLESRGLTPKDVYKKMKGKIACCWEKEPFTDDTICHRSFLAQWVELGVGLDLNTFQEVE